MTVLDGLQLVGAALVLAGFALSQHGRLDPDGPRYLTLNAAGSGLLAMLALLGGRWGFLLLEGVWCLVSLAGLLALARRGAGR